MKRTDVGEMSNNAVRRFCWTLNNYTEEEVKKAEEFVNEFCKYGIFGKELGENGTPHLQGFCNLIKPMRFNTIKQRLGNRIHLEKAAGSDEQNKDYCSKSGEVFEKGSPIKQGQRSDLESVISTIQSGVTCRKQIATAHPAAYIRYFRGIENYLMLTKPIPSRNFKSDVYYYWGPPGSGKSARALREATETTEGNTSDIYYKPRGLWWDGYYQQTCVIIDDFYGWIKYDELLKICDRYPYKVQIKGGFQEFTSKKIWITSNVDIDDLYKFIGYKSAAFARRITNKVYMD
ncbi:Rep [bat associated cyclovirus Vr1]|uniref:Replication-associated protein n=1 Tax=bat associated cyclovirus Vr1 TaxID=3070183 RepID=A0AA48XT79_9CIRC|nr:Rep [Bat associated cyclovirus]UBK24594.1 Rep [bat associated cyclovirus Vr1]